MYVYMYFVYVCSMYIYMYVCTLESVRVALIQSSIEVG